MISLTALVRPWFVHKAHAQGRYATREGLEQTQRAQLAHLLHRAADTAQGRRYRYECIASYEHYAAAVPVSEYPDIRRDVLRMVAGEADVLWPGVCRRFAQSSGTSDGKSKYIPVTAEALRTNHYAGASVAVANYLAMHPDSHLFDGQTFILGGSFANEVADLPPRVKVGDLSAHLIEAINPLVNLVRVPSKQVALMADWHAKLPALVQASLHADITNISGVPSWFLTVLQKVAEAAGADNIRRVWPRLEVFFHGGIAFGPYRSQYEALCPGPGMHYHENYNASEGFFATQDADIPGVMRLLADIGVFYELVPLDALESASRAAIPVWQAEAGRTYALVITAPNGLWRYMIGDTVRIESTEPLRISIAGRTKSFINAFGEEVMVHNTDAALAAACRATGAQAHDYTVGPVFAKDGRRGHHRWIIEWDKPPADMPAFEQALDKALQAENSDYQAKRTGDIFLECLRVDTAPGGTFDRWLQTTGKLGGQRKIPRLSNTTAILDQLDKIKPPSSSPRKGAGPRPLNHCL